MKTAAYVIGGVLAAIGLLLVVGTVVTNTGLIPVCDTGVEHGFASPAGTYVAVIETADCGRAGKRLTVKVLGKESSLDHVFIGMTKSTAAFITPRWQSESRLELTYYSKDISVSFPSQGLDGTNSFSGLPVVVSYKAR